MLGLVEDMTVIMPCGSSDLDSRMAYVPMAIKLQFREPDKVYASEFVVKINQSGCLGIVWLYLDTLPSMK